LSHQISPKKMEKYFKSIVLVFGTFLILGWSVASPMQSSKYFELMKNIEIFTNLYKELNTYYVDELDPGKMMRIGLDAMVSALDPYTNYISETDIESYRLANEGKANGIGANSRKIGAFITLVEIYKDLSADEAGLKVGDIILAIDGQEVSGKNQDEVDNILRGYPGTKVNLTIQRPGTVQPFEVTVTRTEIESPNVPFSGLLKNDIGYINLTTFTQRAGANVGNALKNLQAENPGLKGVVLDLRDNGGGLLNEAINVCNIFIPNNQLVVTTKGKVKEWDRTFNTRNEPIDRSIPLAVIINKYSASASEIVSGVIQDYDRGVIIGQSSYGKGLVQNTRDIGYNAKVKLTTAKYYVPSGRCIQSVAYENGEPVKLPDSLRASFKTANGRTVLDGGGVDPDIEITHPSDLPLVKYLIDQHLIFEYVNTFTAKNPSIPNVGDFSFLNYDDFLSFLDGKNFQYQSIAKKLLEELANATAEEGIQSANELESLQNKLKEQQQKELQNLQTYIVPIIEKEIASRYYYQDGRIKMGLKNDAEISKAIEILSNPELYQTLLTSID
jgi:carboxyl-terminal processing protease